MSTPFFKKQTSPPYCYGVVGLGSTGCSVVRFLAGKGFSIIAMDTRNEPSLYDDLQTEHPNIPFVVGALDYDLLKCCEEVVVSPGVALEHPTLQRLKENGTKLIGDIELFIRYVDAPFIGITGTNGKTTVTTMVHSMLMNSGVHCFAGGNLGIPALDLLGKHPKPDLYILEVSSFQLLLVSAFSAELSCILNITPDHLDRHHTFEEYQKAKLSILEFAKTVLVNLDDRCMAKFVTSGKKVGFFDSLPTNDSYGVRTENDRKILCDHNNDFLAIDELQVSGRHNELNALAALAICSEYLGVVPKTAVEVLKKFVGLPHRMEKIAVIKGVAFVNDSKATNLAAAEASISCLMSTHRGIVILGGDSKHAQFETLATFLSHYVHTAILIGQAAEKIESVLVDLVDCITVYDMGAAVTKAFNQAKPGETVLLAPGCSSFDMFDDYAHRGNVFKEAVMSLEAVA
jgi:UDP-N-acetylmuramoylalanine--D-glutamate ligase